jgi:GNAT superfamily N-acetyltransferase
MADPPFQLNREWNGLLIKQAVPGDCTLIIEILDEVRAWLRNLGLSQWPSGFEPDWVLEMIARGRFFLVYRQDKAIAVFRLQDKDPDFWEEDEGACFYFHTFALRRSNAGQGTGRKILEWVIGYSRSHGKKYLRLDTPANNPTLNRYYLEAGFTYSGKKMVWGTAYALYQFSLASL